MTKLFNKLKGGSMARAKKPSVSKQLLVELKSLVILFTANPVGDKQAGYVGRINEIFEKLGA